jgi:hypothetical protein
VQNLPELLVEALQMLLALHSSGGEVADQFEFVIGRDVGLDPCLQLRGVTAERLRRGLVLFAR